MSVLAHHQSSCFEANLHAIYQNGEMTCLKSEQRRFVDNVSTSSVHHQCLIATVLKSLCMLSHQITSNCAFVQQTNCNCSCTCATFKRHLRKGMLVPCSSSASLSMFLISAPRTSDLPYFKTTNSQNASRQLT